MKNFFGSVVQYFLQGLLIIGPLGVTVYIVYVSVLWMDNLWQLEEYPGLGIAIILLSITAIGYLGTLLISKPLLAFFEGIILRIPLINGIYSSIKDVVSAFVGNKKKFDKPVIVTLESGSGLKRIGFVTHENLQNINMSGFSAVFFPHSLALSGNLWLIPNHLIEPLDVKGSQAMKFVISGGLSWAVDTE